MINYENLIQDCAKNNDLTTSRENFQTELSSDHYINEAFEMMLFVNEVYN